MRLHFLGGARTVTGSRFLLETDRARVLIDCGMFQGSPHEVVRNRVPLAMDARQLDAVLLTHAHLDHSGLLPPLVTQGSRAPIWATAATVELAMLVLLDSAKLQEEFTDRAARRARRDPEANAQRALERRAELEAAVAEAAERDPETELREQGPRVRTDIDAPLYVTADAERVRPLFRQVTYDREVEVAPGVAATFFDAGHILGSAIVRVRAEGRTLVFSGDLGRRNTPILRDPTVCRYADHVIVESTYGGREHGPREEAVRLLGEAVRAVHERGSVLLIPAFAIGRTQEVVWELDALLRRGDIPHVSLFLDSPMASRATDIYRRHAGMYDEETRRLLAEHDDPLAYPGETVVNAAKASRELQRAPGPRIVVASNGMLTGGRVVSHFRELVGDERSVLLFVGYQGQGTLGGRILEGARTVEIDGETRDVRCEVRALHGFSAHADEPGLLEWLGGFATGTTRPKRVFIVHGDPPAQAALEPKIQALGFATRVPEWRESVELD